MSEIILSLCDLTGNMVRPWAEAGFECWCVDIQHSIRRTRTESVGAGRIVFAWGDVRSWCPPEGKKIIRLFAFPPCTDLAVSGARDFQAKRGWMLADALQIFDSCAMAAAYSGAPYMIENPVSRLSSHRRPPDHLFHPWEYAGYLNEPKKDNTQKKTCLWTGNGFVMPAKNPAPAPHREDCWKAAPGDDRPNLRSATPMGFARAVYEANRDAKAEAA